MKEIEVRFLDKYLETFALKMCRTGCNPINYKILNMLPATKNEIADAIGLTHMPTHKRITELIQAELIVKKKYGERLELTELGKSLIGAINKMREQVIWEMAK